MIQLESLPHVVRQLPNNGMVMVLNTGAVITPEAEAMLQALHSRSLGGIREHLKTLAAKGPEKFMKKFLVGYGHKSIGDCGTTTIFVEGVSMLVAKAIQDWLLYSGQEASTRYIDFADQPFIDPIGSADSHRVLETWREFYLASQEPVRKYLMELFPRNDDEDENLYQKAINARGFDILRGFLPAGASTKLSWHTNIRQAADHIGLLRHHPLLEVQVVAEAMESALREAHPSSFGYKLYEDTEAYRKLWMNSGYYFDGYFDNFSLVRVKRDSIDKELLHSEYGPFLKNRPAKTELPKQAAECGTMQFEFLLDFGSFRDIQRQRSVIQRMPLLGENYGMHPWYFASLPEKERGVGKNLVSQQCRKIKNMVCNIPNRHYYYQYYYPMGMLVPCRLTGDLSALVYIAELRAQTTVHPTLQEIAIAMADILEKRFGNIGLNLYVNRDLGRFDIKRGKHDIVLKN